VNDADPRPLEPARRATGTVRAGTVRWLFVAAWAAVIFGMSSLPGSQVPGRFGTQAHFVEYAILAALLYRALRMHTNPLGAALWAIVLASGYAVTDELHQSFVPMRVPDVADWAVDTAGALTGALLAAGAERLARGHRRES